MDLNKLFLIGNLASDPNFRSTSGGKSVADFRLASTTKRGQNEDTLFIDCVTWEKGADFARNYLKKGSRVLVEGRLKQETWQDRETQQNRSKIVVVADRIQFAESKRESAPRERDDYGGGEPY